jgi:arsenate reductase
MATSLIGATSDPPRVLFLDATNCCRSLIAEALLRHYAGNRVESASAGVEPAAEVHPLTLKVLSEVGVDARGLRAKGVVEFLAKIPIVYAILLGEPGEPRSPRIYPFARSIERWLCADPGRVVGTEDERLEEFRHTRELLATRIRRWLSRLRTEEQSGLRRQPTARLR